jgi:hypothetical protein
VVQKPIILSCEDGFVGEIDICEKNGKNKRKFD